MALNYIKPVFKEITVTEFRIEPIRRIGPIRPVDYRFNSEFETVYKKDFAKDFRTIYISLPDDFDQTNARITHLVGIETFNEFTQFRQNFVIIVCQKPDGWDNITSLKVKYPILTPEIVEINRQITELERQKQLLSIDADIINLQKRKQEIIDNV